MFLRRLSVTWIVFIALGFVMTISGVLGRSAFLDYREADRAGEANESHSKRFALMSRAQQDIFDEFGALMAAAVFSQPERYAAVESSASALTADIASLARLVPADDPMASDVREIQDRIGSSRGHGLRDRHTA